MPVWLRGGWAVDFYLGEVTRAHADIDWFVMSDDAPRLVARLVADGCRDVTTAPREQQIDLVRGSIEHGIALARHGTAGQPLVGGGPWSGEPWPSRMLLDGPRCRIGDVTAYVISPEAQIEIKELTPMWNPRLSRRGKDVEDIRLLRAKLGSQLQTQFRADIRSRAPGR